MRFKKIGLVFKPMGELIWSRTHAQVPFAVDMGGFIRVLFSTRDENSRSSVGLVDLSKSNPKEVIRVYKNPSLTFGEQGRFDDSGTMPSWVVQDEDRWLLYYTGWNRSESASYRLSIGLAESKNYGESFTPLFEGPLLDRSTFDPIWVGQPCVIREGEIWKMWYLSCTKISLIEGRPEPHYNVKYATSKDGVNWSRSNQVCIDYTPGKVDAIGRPCVWKGKDKQYWMLHSNRQASGYREKRTAGYSLSLSKSKDGIVWEDYGKVEGMEKSEEGWDSIMMEYASVLHLEDRTLVFYNGNGFGQSGFGVAELIF